MVIGLQIRKFHRGAESAPSRAVLDSKSPASLRLRNDERTVLLPVLEAELRDSGSISTDQ